MAKTLKSPTKTGKPTTVKSPEKAKRETAPAKPPKPAKKKTKEQPLNRKERQQAAWLRKTGRKAAQQAITEVGAKASAGLTYDQLKASSGLVSRQPQPASPTLEQIALEIVTEQIRQLESAEPVSMPAIPDPEVRFTERMESFSSVTTRKVVADEIRQLLEKTGLIFNAYREPSILAAPSVAVEDTFEEEPEDSPLRLRLAEVILADDPGEAIEEFLEEVYDRIQELQLIAGSLEPESELEKSARLGVIDEVTAASLKKVAVEEAIRLDLSKRLAGLTANTSAPVEIDETFASLIAEAAQAAEVRRRERIAFRQTLSQGLRQRKEGEGRRSSRSLEESGDEEFIRFLLAHRGDLAAIRKSLPFHLREQVFQLLEEDERKGPFRREIAEATAAAEWLWTGLKTRLAAGTNYPETAVARNATAMKDLLGTFAHIRALHVQQLEELDKPPADHGKHP